MKSSLSLLAFIVIHSAIAAFPGNVLCPAVFDPVCSTAGKTFSSRCRLNAAGHTFAYEGPCGGTSAPTSSPPTTSQPTISPTPNPTTNPTTNTPTDSPTTQPSLAPSISPTKSPTISPTVSPSSQPTNSPSSQPTNSPSSYPTNSPSSQPTNSPSSYPTNIPTYTPSTSPSFEPTSYPSISPTQIPTTSPSAAPTGTPTSSPSATPSQSPSISPTSSPTTSPLSSTEAVDSSVTSGASVMETVSPLTWWPLGIVVVFCAELHFAASNFKELSSHEPWKRGGVVLMAMKCIVSIALCIASVSMNLFGSVDRYTVEVVLLLSTLGTSMLFEILFPQMFEEISLFSWNADDDLFSEEPKFKVITAASICDTISLSFVGIGAFILHNGSSLDSYNEIIAISSLIVLILHSVLIFVSTTYFHSTLRDHLRSANGAHFALLFERETLLKRTLTYGIATAIARTIQVCGLTLNIMLLNGDYFDDITLLVVLLTEVVLGGFHLMIVSPVSPNIIGLLDTNAHTTLKVVHFT